MPPKIDTLLNTGDDVIDAAETSVISSVRESEQEIYKEIIKILDQVDISEGKLKNTAKAKAFLMGLDQRITNALYNSPYSTAVSGLIKDYDKIVENNIKLQSVLNKKTISQKMLSGIQQLEVNNTLDRLLGSGIANDFIRPIRQQLYRNIALGASVADTKQALEDFIISNPDKESVLSRYVGQVSRDSIMQFDGAIQDKIASELDLPDYIYTGSLLKDSRAQCVYWVDKGELNGEELVDEIDTALNGGSLGGKKCSGMNPACTVDTFSIYRGGYNCRHRAIATLL